MHFAFIGRDKRDALATRLAQRDKHRAFLHGDLSAYGAKVIFGGPLLAADGETPNGSLVVIEASSLADAQRLFAADPYMQAGIFETADVMPWRFAIGQH